MGKTGDSFDRELGKNAGKAVSNLLFGNKHATPIRLIRDAKIDRIEEQQKVERELLEKQQQYEIKQQERTIIGVLTVDVDSKISAILNLQFPTTESEFIVIMNELKSYIYVHGWKSFIGLNSFNGQQNRLNNKLSTVILRKFNQGLVIMERDFPNNIEFESYKSLSKISKIKKFFIQYILIIIPVLLIISLFIIDYVQRTF
jgi:hypothetical protein